MKDFIRKIKKKKLDDKKVNKKVTITKSEG
jgi:hypothetical protein